MKKLILTVTVIAISLFFLPEVYVVAIQFGLGTRGFVKKVVEKGQAEGKIAKTEEEKKQHDENSGGGEETSVASVTISPTSANLDISATTYFTATARDANNNILNVVFSWTTSNSAVVATAKISDNKALVTAIAEGTASITASVSGKSAGATVEVAGPLSIFAVQISTFQKWPEWNYGEVSLKVKWQTNKPATSKVVWMEDLYKQTGLVGNAPICAGTEEYTTLIQQHEVEVYFVRPGTKTWLTITSNVSSEQVGEEASIITQAVPGEIGIYHVWVQFIQSMVHPSQWATTVKWNSLQQDTIHSLYYSYDNANWTWVTTSANSYDSIYQCYYHKGENVDTNPGSRLYYKLDDMVFYVDLPVDENWGSGGLYPQKP